jgi:DNA-binding CsgD family transcriptional regulator
VLSNARDGDGRPPCTGPCTWPARIAAGIGHGDTQAVKPPIERDSELELLAGVIDSAAGGHGGAVLIEGEAGIGKTRLMSSARAHASGAGARVLHTSADETESGVPLAAARALLARATRGIGLEGPGRLGALALDGGLSDPAGPGSRADEVVHALWWLLVELADEQPLAVFFDDAQWADDLTLRVLRTAARRAGELPLALVVAARPAAPGQPHSALAAERAFARLEPGPLSAAGTARLLEEVLGRPGSVAIVGRARAVTGGNPLYLSELLRDARDRGADPTRDDFLDRGAPPQLVRIVADRMGRLPAAAAALAHAVAVLGSDAEVRLARALAGLTAIDAIAAEETLRAERVLDATAYAFIHPLVAAAAREGMRATDTAEVHARAAALLTDEGADDQRVAEHLVHAPPRGDPSVVATLRRAAEAARRLGVPASAARLLARALAEPPAPEVVDTVEFERGRALLDAGDEAGAGVLEALLRRGPEASVQVDAARHLARRLALRGRGADAVGVLRAVLETLADTERELRLELLVELAFVGSSEHGRDEQALQAMAAEAELSPGGTPAQRMLSATVHVFGRQDPAQATGTARDLLAQRLHRDFRGGFAVGSITFWATGTLMAADALDEVEQAMDDLLADAAADAAPDLIAGAHWQHAQIAYLRGDLPRCELEASAAIEAGGDFARRLATPWLVMALTEQGRLDEAERLLGAAGMLGQMPPGVMVIAALGARGRLRLAQGDPSRTVEDLAAAVDRNTAAGLERVEPPWRPLLAEALVLAGRTEDAADAAAAYGQLAAAWDTPRAQGHAARMRALAAPRAQAIPLLEEACTQFAASHARLEHARSLAELGARRRAAGDRRAARAILRDAHDIAHACGATALCERTRAELLLAGGRPRPPAGAGAEALTPGERRVAELAAQGATNREIAQRLYLSPKTIEMHLRSAYRKLDLPGRDGLASALDPSPEQGSVQGADPSRATHGRGRLEP